jgi:hypothetical protein
MSITIPARTRRLAALIRADLPGRRGTPHASRFVIAAVAAVLLSLLACAAVAAVTIALVPSVGGYEHLRFHDWAKLTVVGIVLASLGWPLAGALWSRARVPFLILTALVTVVSFAPDLWIWRQGQPTAGVLALLVMHVAVAVVTYPALVLIAPRRR